MQAQKRLCAGRWRTASSIDWVRVRFKRRDPVEPDAHKESEALEGWVHATAVTGQQVKVEAGPRPSWLKMGGKALKDWPVSENEKDYLKSRRLDRKPVARMETHFPSVEALEKFLRNGKLGIHRTDWPSLVEGVEP